MASTSSSGTGKKKKTPGLMDQISTLFGGEKKKRSKGSFRGHLASSPQQSSARRKTTENAVVQFFRSLVSSPPPKSRWRDVLGLSDSLLLDDFETARLFLNHSRPRRRVLRAQSRRSEDAETKAHCPRSSPCDDPLMDQGNPNRVPPQNAGAPSSELSTNDKKNPDPKPTGREEEEEEEESEGETQHVHRKDSQPEEMLTG